MTSLITLCPEANQVRSLFTSSRIRILTYNNMLDFIPVGVTVCFHFIWLISNLTVDFALCEAWICYYFVQQKGRAVAQALSCWFPTTAARVRAMSGHVGFVVDKVALGQVFSWVLRFSPANHHSTKFFFIILTQGRYNRPVCGRCAEWTLWDSTPQYTNLKKLCSRGHYAEIVESVQHPTDSV
jgi:hypothetical protein